MRSMLERAKQRLVRFCARSRAAIANPPPAGALVLSWAREGAVAANWGDKLNPVLAAHLSGRPVVHVDDLALRRGHRVHAMIGSSLAQDLRWGRTIWGTGFLDRTTPLRVGGRPVIHAVRGHLSRQRLLALGLDCPPVVGDPALLMARLHQPAPALQRFRIGVVPHFRDADLPVVARDALPDDHLLIDITGDIATTADAIAACDFIVSSSLHGLICAQAYGIPAAWIRLSDRLLGDGFKFHDYLSSIGLSVDGPVPVASSADLAAARDRWRPQAFGGDGASFDPDRLMAACPFAASAA